MPELLNLPSFAVALPALVGLISIFLALKPIRLVKAERKNKENHAKAVMDEIDRLLADKIADMDAVKALPPPRSERQQVRMRA